MCEIGHYECGNFFEVDNIGVICRGSSIGEIEKCSQKFDHCFLIGQHTNSLKFYV